MVEDQLKDNINPDLGGAIKNKRDEKLKAKLMGNDKGSPWFESEKLKFVKALMLHGRNWVEVSKHVGTKDRL